MAYGWKNTLTEATITPEAHYLSRRDMLFGSGALIAGGMAASQVQAAEKLEPNTWAEITTYNNFYEFGTSKDAPIKNSGRFKPRPWSVQINGLVDRPGEYALDDILGKMTIEERIYRFRCVEAWSMVVPWNGFELRDLLSLAGVQSGAKYVAFETVARPAEMPGLRSPVLDWPYVEGLRLDEAMHPLTLMAKGIYGKDLPNQNGAPLRLVVPWKYGFKSIKSIIRMTLTDTQPPTSWNKANPREYGFYSNVNPKVSHPRWSQATERRLGGGLFARREPTLMFNGYSDEVASLYRGMDLAVHF